MTIDDMLREWVRWVTATDECFPQGYPPECTVERVALPYKVLLTEDEALDEMERTKEPDRIIAERCERWIHMLEPVHRITVQTHHVHWPDSMGRAWDLTSDQLADRRARRVERVSRESGYDGPRITVDEYHRLYGEAIAELREALANV